MASSLQQLLTNNIWEAFDRQLASRQRKTVPNYKMEGKLYIFSKVRYWLPGQEKIKAENHLLWWGTQPTVSDVDIT